MARPERHDAKPHFVQPTPTADGHSPGGQVGWMQADLARRLASGGAARASASVGGGPDERMVRFVSAAGGYSALAAAYAGVVLLILR